MAGTNIQSSVASPSTGTGLQKLAPSHDPGSNDSIETTGESTPNDSADEDVTRRSASGDGSSRGSAPNEVTSLSLSLTFSPSLSLSLAFFACVIRMTDKSRTEMLAVNLFPRLNVVDLNCCR